MSVLIKKVSDAIYLEFNLMAIVSGRVLYIYKYDPKKIPDQPFEPFKTVPLTEDPKFVIVAKDGNICIFY